jgi:hypothetical protein
MFSWVLRVFATFPKFDMRPCKRLWGRLYLVLSFPVPGRQDASFSYELGLRVLKYLYVVEYQSLLMSALQSEAADMSKKTGKKF